MIVCVVDTSVVCELFGVPGKSQRPHEARAELEQKLRDRERLVLPLAVILETGNHIAHVSDGAKRRVVAQRFAQWAIESLEGKQPFAPAPLPDETTVRGWLEGFVADATRGLGLGDRSVISIWEQQRATHHGYGTRVYIWSYDAHLAGYDSRP